MPRLEGKKRKARSGKTFAQLVRSAEKAVNNIPSAIDSIDESLSEGYGKISFTAIQEKLDAFQVQLDKSKKDPDTRTDFLMTLADLFFTTALTYDGSGKTFLHPSSFMEDCQRKLYYDLSDTDYDFAPEEPDARLQKIFDVGTIMHVYIQYHLWKSGVLKEAEANAIIEEFRVHGKGDGILIFKRGGEKILLEIKTANSFSFSKAKREPINRHKKQVAIYGQALGIKKVMFVYINKDTQEMAEHYWTIPEAIIAETRKKMELVNDSVNSNKAPKGICKSKLDTTAMKCPYSEICFKK